MAIHPGPKRNPRPVITSREEKIIPGSWSAQIIVDGPIRGRNPVLKALFIMLEAKVPD